MRGDIDSPEEIENEELRQDEEEALVELERFEELENTEKKKKSLTISVQYAEPDPKLLSDKFNLGSYRNILAHENFDGRCRM